MRERLAGYKVPKRLVFAPSVGRSPSGKADYKAAQSPVKAALGLPPGELWRPDSDASPVS